MIEEELSRVPLMFLQGEIDRRRAGPIRNTQGNPECSAQPMPQAMREGARSLIRKMIEEYRKRAEDLTFLDAALPKELPPGADEALFNLLCKGRP